jgi:hypothetical protein
LANLKESADRLRAGTVPHESAAPGRVCGCFRFSVARWRFEGQRTEAGRGALIWILSRR